MPLESIISHISGEAGVQRDKIIQQARLQADMFIQEAKLQAGRLYQQILDKERALSLAQKQKLIVQERLGQRRNLLQAKQELIGRVFEELKSGLREDNFSHHSGIPLGAVKKQQVLIDKVKEMPEDLDFYLGKLRQDYEAEIARILFG